MPQSYTPKEMLTELVSFNTVSDRSNLDLIAFVENYLSDFGLSSVRVPNETGQKAALFATIGPKVDGGIVLSAHTDVVPVEGQNWSRDPFSTWEKDGRLYGRGTADMKGFAATCLAKVPDFLSANLEKPIHIALSYDEEVGCFGAPPLIEALVCRWVTPPTRCCWRTNKHEGRYRAQGNCRPEDTNSGSSGSLQSTTQRCFRDFDCRKTDYLA